MQLQNNISSDSQRVHQIRIDIGKCETGIDKKVARIRSLLFEVYQDRLYVADGHKDFKPWIAEFVPKQSYTNVNDWVISDGIRLAIRGWADATNWSDHAVLALRGVPDELLEDVVRALPPNPTHDRVKQEVDYVKPNNLVPFRSSGSNGGGGSGASTSKIRSSGFWNKEAAETDEIIQGNREKMIDLEQKANRWEQKAIVLEQKLTELEQKNTTQQPVTTDVEMLQQQIKDADQERADLMNLLNDQSAEINRLTKLLNRPPAPAIAEPIEDFAVDKDKKIAKQAKRIEELEAIVKRLQKDLNDRDITIPVDQELKIARSRIVYLEKSVDGMFGADIAEAIKAYAPTGELGYLQSEIISRDESIARTAANFEALEKKSKELRAENNKLAMDNVALRQKVQSLEELVNPPAPRQQSNDRPLPEAILEAIAQCERHGYKVMAHRTRDGFAVVDDSGTRKFGDVDDTIDFLYASLDHFTMTA